MKEPEMAKKPEAKKPKKAPAPSPQALDIGIFNHAIEIVYRNMGIVARIATSRIVVSAPVVDRLQIEGRHRRALL